MTEAIKQWIADQVAATYPDYKGPNEAVASMVAECQKSCSNGLTKGIEIVEGFAEWTQETGWNRSGEWWFFGSGVRATTSDLLKNYLKTLEP